MTVKEYLFTANMTPEQLAEHLGYKSKATITKRLDEEMPERWSRKLEELAELGISPNPAAGSGGESEESSERDSKLTDDQINDWLKDDGRENDQNPNINQVENRSPEVIGPQQIKISTIKGYIEMIYGGAESLCRSRGDDIAAEVLHKYTPEYSEAWIEYIKYDSRILKYLESLQIGTPLGNLIGIHAISIGAYALARITAREIAAANAAAEREQAEQSDHQFGTWTPP